MSDTSEKKRTTAAERYDRALRRSLALYPLSAGCPVPMPTAEWPEENVALLERYRDWLEAGGAAQAVIDHHRLPMAGHVLGLALKPHDQLDVSEKSLEAVNGDLGQALAYIVARGKSDSWVRNGRFSLVWFRRFLRLERGLPVEQRVMDSYDCPARYSEGLPAWLMVQMKQYLHIRQVNWRPSRLHVATNQFWASYTRLWRWLFARRTINELTDIKRQDVFDFMDEMLTEGYAPNTVNQHLYAFQAMLRFLQGRSCQVPLALLNVSGLKEPDSLPRFLTDEQVGLVRNDLEERVKIVRTQARRRDVLLDRAAFYLLWQGGLRLGELEELTLQDLNMAQKQLIVRRGKGMQDRTVYLTETAVAAPEDYLAVRGPGNSDHLFLYRTRPLCKDLVRDRLKAASDRTGVKVTPHMLRHTFATQLVNAGCRVTTIQSLLGHKRLNSTMIYARVHDQTVARDYFEAMAVIEKRLAANLPQEIDQQPPTNGHHPGVNGNAMKLLRLVAALEDESLTESKVNPIVKTTKRQS